jgi:hypothetical protein
VVQEGRARIRCLDGSEHEFPFGSLEASVVVEAAPWRTFRWRRSQKHYSGWYWSATMGHLVGYESRLELARLVLADWDPDGVAVVSQPMLLSFKCDDRARRHVPDFLLIHRSGPATVVNVKPPMRLADDDVRALFDAVGELCNGRGWRSEVWSGADAQVLENVRFLAGYRRPWLFNVADVERARNIAGAGGTLGSLEAVCTSRGVCEARAVLLHLVWRSEILLDLSAPIECLTEVRACR